MIRSTHIPWLGLFFMAFGLFVWLVAIPAEITSPSNVPKLVLSPIFWPRIVSWIIIFLGAILTFTQILMPAEASQSTPAAPDEVDDDPGLMGWLRLAATGLVMVGLVELTAILGLVWTSMLAFAALSVIIKSSRPVLSLIVAIALPLALYVFFNHVAGVAVPQGQFIRLPS